MSSQSGVEVRKGCLITGCPAVTESNDNLCKYHIENDFPHLRTALTDDPVNHPSHYTDVVPGIECIDVTKHFSFVRGNAIKYLWRAGAKGNLKEDLEKAKWYIEQELRDLVLQQPEGRSMQHSKTVADR